MGAITITFIQMDGVEKTITDAEVSESLMELAKANGVEGILGDCGGGCACATCHVFVEPEWQEKVGAPDDIEDMTLEMVSDIRKPSSRLCCQISVSEELDGLRVAVAPHGF
jgi:2Fe-2S ferredoxin